MMCVVCGLSVESRCREHLTSALSAHPAVLGEAMRFVTEIERESTARLAAH
jgi:hypothetical protein